MIKRFRSFNLIVAIFCLSTMAEPLLACPFCTAIAQTLSEEIASADVSIVARLTRMPGSANPEGESLTNSPRARFAIDGVLKGQQHLDATASVSAVFFGDAKPGDLFLMQGSTRPELTWSPPMRLNARQHAYILGLMQLPKEGPQRLDFIQKYLEDEDSLLAADAYGEFARASYTAVKQLKPLMNHDQLVAWIDDPNVPSSRQRLYLTMLGVCGSQDDLPLLERRLRGTDLQSKSGLDATIACYLTLRGPAGMELIEGLYLKKGEDNFSDNYADVYAAIMALRFHGTEGDIIPRQRVIQAFEHLLDNPQMADLVIPDLARWEDWSQLERLVKLFKNVDQKASWVRIPIINFARACPLPVAQEALKEFEAIDPDAVKNARTFFPTVSEQDQ